MDGDASQSLRASKNGDREMFISPVQLTEQDWQPYTVDAYSTVSDDHTFK